MNTSFLQELGHKIHTRVNAVNPCTYHDIIDLRKGGKITDYRTTKSGITAEILELRGKKYEDIQEKVREFTGKTSLLSIYVFVIH